MPHIHSQAIIITCDHRGCDAALCCRNMDVFFLVERHGACCSTRSKGHRGGCAKGNGTCRFIGDRGGRTNGWCIIRRRNSATESDGFVASIAGCQVIPGVVGGDSNGLCCSGRHGTWRTSYSKIGCCAVVHIQVKLVACAGFNTARSTFSCGDADAVFCFVEIHGGCGLSVAVERQAYIVAQHDAANGGTGGGGWRDACSGKLQGLIPSIERSWIVPVVKSMYSNRISLSSSHFCQITLNSHTEVGRCVL